jgi:periplasmic protein TonB
MFEDSLARFEDVRGGRRKWIALGCLVVQAGAIAAMVVVPLMNPARLPATTTAKLKWVSLARPKVVPPKPVVVRVTDAAATRAPSSAAQTTAHETQRPLISRTPVASDPDIPVLMPFGQMRPSGPALIGEIGAGVGDGSRPVVSVKPSGDGSGGKPMPISTGVSAGLLLTPIRPEYPRIAIAARVEGVVLVTAIIDKNGRIVGLKVVSGPPMLQQAAADAVRDARYRPYLLNGQPTEVVTTFSVNFRMSGG